MEVSRRDLFKTSAAIAALGVMSRVSRAADDPLPSWNDVPAKKAILGFVHSTTDHLSPKFVSKEERIATFDQDGTLWVEPGEGAARSMITLREESDGLPAQGCRRLSRRSEVSESARKQRYEALMLRK